MEWKLKKIESIIKCTYRKIYTKKSSVSYKGQRGKRFQALILSTLLCKGKKIRELIKMPQAEWQMSLLFFISCNLVKEEEIHTYMKQNTNILLRRGKSAILDSTSTIIIIIIFFYYFFIILFIFISFLPDFYFFFVQESSFPSESFSLSYFYRNIAGSALAGFAIILHPSNILYMFDVPVISFW